MGRLFEYDNDMLEGETVDLDIFLGAISFGKGAMCVFAPKAASAQRESMLNKPDYLYPALCILLYGYFVQNQIWSFLVWLGGGFVVFFLTRVLNGDATFVGTLSITGYCTAPLLVMSLLLWFLPHSFFLSLVRFVVKFVCLAWSSYGAATVLVPPHLSNRRLLVLYPIVLFFMYLISLHRIWGCGKAYLSKTFSVSYTLIHVHFFIKTKQENWLLFK